ncbi:MAG: methyltransferase [Gammaproteobacteria bacterium]|nr:methyltransferase [Gammaproteobacteria bacterium]
MKTETHAVDALRNDIVFSDTLMGEKFTFHSTWGIFSPRCVDDGSRLLLKYLDIKPADDCLDLGCGYGVLGLYMARIAAQGSTCLIDKDFVAVNYSIKNAKFNQLDNTDIFLSNGFDQIGNKKFDVIVSNIPAKVGKELLNIYLVDALAHLKPGGIFYIVTVTGLRRFFERGFKEVFGNYKKLKQGKAYTVAMGIKN